MRYRFERFELDTELFALRDGGGEVHLEPLAFDLLRFLVEHAGQVLSRDALVEHVWKGRFVSDATVASCVKSVRQALGDSGEEQKLIRTVRGRGFQLVAPVESAPGGSSSAVVAPLVPQQVVPVPVTAPPRIAVLPLFPLTSDPRVSVLGDALAQEVIHELSRLHWLHVIARGSAFQFRGQEVDLARVGEVLGATYVLTGTVLRSARRCEIAVELCRAATATVIWAEKFDLAPDELMHLRSGLAARIVGAVEPRIQIHEAVEAAKVPTEHLDAWAAYHRGLWHMYRFNRQDNETAARLFAHAVRLDASFARAHAGLSFTHFQEAFLGFTSDTEDARREAMRCAERSMELDPLDPFVNLTMGRTEWLNGDLEGAMPWMERSAVLSPNYAFALYNGALVGTLLGDGDSNAARVEKAMSLSPIDPLTYAMLATRALTHAVRGDFVSAADWAERAVRSPNAHIQIFAVAAFANEMAGKRKIAEAHVAHIRRAHPAYEKSAFLRSFPFRDGATRLKVERSLDRLGL